MIAIDGSRYDGYFESKSLIQEPGKGWELIGWATEPVPERSDIRPDMCERFLYGHLRGVPHSGNHQP